MKRIVLGLLITVCFLQLALGLGPVRPVSAARHDVGMFYDSLSPYGKWIDFGKYGPVWYPANVSSSWRPYLDGRWVPGNAGWVFETSEPWGWATYHYGNWMPTTQYGWVWSPGSTWYPSTAAWRTSEDYVGWAPIPPPDYVPEPPFYPAGGYNPEAAILDNLPAPLWIFALAAEFLLGFGQPFAPSYSYYNYPGILAPLSYAPLVYGGTFPLVDFYYPAYAPGAYYIYGPPLPYVSRVTNVNIVQINNFITTYNYTKIRNVLPPPGVLNRHPYLRGAIPAAVLEGRRFPITRVWDVSRAEHGLNRPGVVATPANLPAPSKTIPRVAPSARAVSFQNLGHIKGMALPRQATQPLTPTMRQQIRTQREMQGPQRMETRPEFRPLAKPEATPKFIPKAPPAPVREVKPSPGQAVPPSRVAPAPEHFQPTPSRPAPQREVRPAPSREFHAPAAREFRPATPREFRPPSPAVRQAMPREFRAAPPPVFRAAPRPAPQPAFHPPAPAPRAISPAPRAPAPARPAPAGPQRPGHK